MEEVEREVEDAAGDGFAVNNEVLFWQVPAARAHQQRRSLLVKFVLFAFRAGIADDAIDGVAQVDMALDGFRPDGREGVLEIGHEDLCPGIQGVDDHFAVNRAGDLDAPVLQVCRNGRNRPVAAADVLCFRQEIGHFSGVDLRLPPRAALQQLFAPAPEGARQLHDKIDGLWRQNLVKGGSAFSHNLHALQGWFDGCHVDDPFDGGRVLCGYYTISSPHNALNGHENSRRSRFTVLTADDAH